MKKWLVLLLLIPLVGLTGCESHLYEGVVYSDDEPFILQMASDQLNILQLTDLHLTYGIDANDRKTLDGIRSLVEDADYDLIVITGDLMMSVTAPSLFGRLVRFMESLETPWTFVFGNHETDYDKYTAFLDQLTDCEYLYFKVGPQLDQGGVGNFRIVFEKDGVPFYTLYLMDSHTERETYTEVEGEYGYVHASQVAWATAHLETDTTDSIFYMHIPLRQFIDPETYTGTFGEDKVYPQGIDTGLFDALVAEGKTKAVFVGHDHLNNFEFTLDGILLAYGQITGYNAYGDLPRGGRVAHIDKDGILTSYIVLESEVSS